MSLLVKAVLSASRPISWVNTAFPFAAGYLMTSHSVDLALVVGTFYFLFPYNLLMYGINDIFDYESDLRNPRKGGVEGALVARTQHRGLLVSALVVNVPFLAVLAILGSSMTWLVLGLSVAAVVAYSAPVLRFKERPFLDSLTSSTHFVSPALYGLVLAGATLSAGVWQILGAFFLWGIASHAFGAVQDVVVDREAGIGSVATAIGACATVRVAAAAYLVAGAVLLLAPWPAPLAALLALPYIANVAPFWSLPDAEAMEANRGWRRFLWLNQLAGFGVTLLLIWAW